MRRVVLCSWTVCKHMSARLAEYRVGTGSYIGFLVTLLPCYLLLSRPNTTNNIK